MAAIKAVIFDLDGVLVDAGAWHYQAFSRALAEHGFALSREEHDRNYDGLPTGEKLKLLSAGQGLPAALYPAISELKQRYTAELINSRCRPRAGQAEMLARLKAENYKLAVASNSRRSTVELVLSKAGLLGCLDFYLSSQDVAAPKPAPEIYLAAFNRLGLAPGACLALEDHPAGLAAAAGAGARVAKVGSAGEVTYAFVKSHILAAEREGVQDEEL